jgi:hypothetical protein
VLDAPSSPGVRRLPPLSDRLVLLVVGGLSALVHVVAIAVGMRVDPSQLRTASLSTLWQLLPARLLRHDLFPSLAHLHSQPPLFNLFTGLLLQLPRATQPSVADVALALSSVVVAVATAGLLLEFRLRRWIVLALVVVFVVADPAQYLYGAFYFYALPTAAIVTALGWAAVRWARTRRAVPGVAFGVLAMLLVLTNSSFQIYTVVLAVVPIVIVLRRAWRGVIAVLVIPLVVVGAWYANDAVQFGTTTTSSWLGMNLARSTLSLDTTTDLNALVRAGVLSPTALIRPFNYLGQYGALGRHVPTGHPALDVRLQRQTPNFNNLSFVRISDRYLSDDLAWIAHRPAQYVRNTTVGLRLWMLPSEQFYATVQALHRTPAFRTYTTIYDTAVLLQPTTDPFAVVAVIRFHVGPTLSNLSFTTILMTLLAIGVLPFVAWRRRRREPALAAGAAAIWVLVASVFVSTTLIEAAENNRFRFELGGLPLVAATVAVAWLLDRSRFGGGLLRGAGGEGDGGAGEALAVDDETPGEAARRSERERAEIDGHRDVDG